MEIFLNKRAMRQVRLSVADAVADGEIDALREDLVGVFSDDDIEEIETPHRQRRLLRLHHGNPGRVVRRGSGRAHGAPRNPARRRRRGLEVHSPGK